MGPLAEVPRAQIIGKSHGTVQRLFWVYVVIAALGLISVIVDDDRDWSSWLGVGRDTALGAVSALYLRSWRTTRRADSEGSK